MIWKILAAQKICDLQYAAPSRPSRDSELLRFLGALVEGHSLLEISVLQLSALELAGCPFPSSSCLLDF